MDQIIVVIIFVSIKKRLQTTTYWDQIHSKQRLKVVYNMSKVFQMVHSVHAYSSKIGINY